MKNYHEEEALGKAYDSRLMRRLLKYAKPFWQWILISILLLLAITGLELLRPYIFKVAIDNHINAYDKPYLVFEDKPDGELEGINYDGLFYIRKDNIEEDKYQELRREQVVYNKGNYYLLDGVIDTNKKFKVTQLDQGFLVKTSDGQEVRGDRLTKDEMALFRQRDADAIFRLALIFVGALLVGFFLRYGQVYLLQWTGQRIIYNIREELFDHLEKLSLTFFDGNPVGRLVTRVTNDVKTLNEMYTNVLVNLFKDLFMLVGILIVMLKLNYRLALYAFTVLPLILASTIIFRKKARAAYRQVRVKLARVNATIAENISGMKIVQIFNQEKKKFNEFDEINDEYYQATLKEIMAYAVFRPVMEVISSLGLAIIIWFGGRSVINGVIEFGILFAFIDYIRRFFRPILDLTQKYNIMQAAMASAERLFILLDTPEDIVNADETEKLEDVKGEIEFKDVWFAYNEDEWV